MSSVSTDYVQTGRVDQKRRTFDALVAAARDLVAEGTTPTIEAAAEAASISRTTAYRYFSNQRDLLVAAHPETGAESLLPDDAPTDDVTARLRLAVDAFIRSNIDNEQQQRTMLRLSLDDSTREHDPLPLRQGRAIAWFEDALAPLRTTSSSAEIRRLAIAIRSAVGIESMAWQIDVAGLTRDEARELMTWTAMALLRAATDHLADVVI